LKRDRHIKIEVDSRISRVGNLIELRRLGKRAIRSLHAKLTISLSINLKMWQTSRGRALRFFAARQYRDKESLCAWLMAHRLENDVHARPQYTE
jgi:hypothetical protein